MRILAVKFKLFKKDQDSVEFQLFKQNREIEINFQSDNVNSEHIASQKAFSIIIGKNGSGKSYFLGKISEIFRFLHKLKQANTKDKFDDFEITYEIKREKFRVINIDGNIECKKTGDNNIEDDIEFSNIVLPTNVLVIGSMLRDRFTYASSDDLFYYYLGQKSTTNAAHIGAFEKKVIFALLEQINSDRLGEIREKLKTIIKFLGYSSIRVVYDLKLKTLKNLQFKVATFNERRKARLKSAGVADLTDDDIKAAHKFLIDNRIKSSRGENALILDLDSDFSNLTDEAITRNLRILNILGFIDTPTIEVKTETSNDFYGDFSSGESNILFHMISMLTHVRNDSLVLIDEPEISLHPTWQIKYIDLLREVINDSKAHVLIASHSHFMVSDLKTADSTLHFIQKAAVTAKINIETISYSTYAWTPEAVLYRVFHMRTPNNFLAKHDLATLVNHLQKDPKGLKDTEKKEIIFAINNLENITDENNTNDPLVSILQNIKNKLPSMLQEE